MQKFIYKLYKFMYGRNGIDELYKVGLILCIILSIINIFLNNRILTLIEFLLIVIIIYRSLSKNITKRRHENNVYLREISKIKVTLLNWE